MQRHTQRRQAACVDSRRVGAAAEEDGRLGRVAVLTDMEEARVQVRPVRARAGLRGRLLASSRRRDGIAPHRAEMAIFPRAPRFAR